MSVRMIRDLENVNWNCEEDRKIVERIIKRHMISPRT